MRKESISTKILRLHGNQWRILRVFKVFSEHPDISKKILFSNFLYSFLFFVIFAKNFFVQKVNFTIFPFKII